MTSSTIARRDEAEIRELIGEQAIAMQARDAERLLTARYAPEIVKFDLAPPLQHTGPELLDVSRLQSWFAGFDGPIDYEIRDLTVTAGEDVAFAHSLNRLSTTPHGATEKFDLWFRATVCLRKIDGAWRITHEHNSTPFYMDGSFKAALDLRP
jgi:ketosteroid isomerase-like protein